jgi:hypothetical protein
MLSNENKNPNTATIEHYQFNLARMKAAQLGSQLIKGEHNAEHREREAQNPAHGVRIRRIDLEKSHRLSRVTVTDDCQNHNSRVASLGAVGQYEKNWTCNDGRS